jgi:ribose transport system substrate-binding protein
MNQTSHARYLVRSVVHASQVLGAFQTPGEAIRLRDVVTRTGLNKCMCFRLLYTLRQCGFIDEVGENSFRLAERARRRRYRFGYAAQGQDSSFPREVQRSLEIAAEREQIELLILNNKYQPKIALRNSELLVKEKPDFVIEFQTDESVAAAIAARYAEAGIPFIAVDVPHPGGTYFGANNYEAGLLAGTHLARWARKNWDGQVDELILVELTRAGSLPRARLHGIRAGLRKFLPMPDDSITTIDGDGQFHATWERVRKHLRVTKARRILVGAANDPSALGALRAFEEAGRAPDCAIVGQNGEPQARAELRVPNTSLIASVAYFPEKYGDGIVQMAIDLLSRKPVPPAAFIAHKLITPGNVDHLYPNDALTGVTADMN